MVGMLHRYNLYSYAILNTCAVDIFYVFPTGKKLIRVSNFLRHPVFGSNIFAECCRIQLFLIIMRKIIKNITTIVYRILINVND